MGGTEEIQEGGQVGSDKWELGIEKAAGGFGKGEKGRTKNKEQEGRRKDRRKEEAKSQAEEDVP